MAGGQRRANRCFIGKPLFHDLAGCWRGANGGQRDLGRQPAVGDGLARGEGSPAACPPDLHSLTLPRCGRTLLGRWYSGRPHRIWGQHLELKQGLRPLSAASRYSLCASSTSTSSAESPCVAMAGCSSKQLCVTLHHALHNVRRSAWCHFVVYNKHVRIVQQTIHSEVSPSPGASNFVA